MAEEAVPVVLLRARVESPVGLLGIREDDARAGVAGGIVAPDIIVALLMAARRVACRGEPWVLVRGVVDDQQLAPVRLLHESPEVLARAVVRVNVPIVGDVVAVVLAR